MTVWGRGRRGDERSGESSRISIGWLDSLLYVVCCMLFDADVCALRPVDSVGQDRREHLVIVEIVRVEIPRTVA